MKKELLEGRMGDIGQEKQAKSYGSVLFYLLGIGPASTCQAEFLSLLATWISGGALPQLQMLSSR